MSGHSHAKTIKHQKELTDQKRGQAFSKIARVVSVAVKESGPNPETNSKLRIAIEMAKKFNMPKENIERAISRGSGATAEEKLEEILFEAYGPGGIAILIEGITDNKNRTLGEIRQILNQKGGKMVAEGGVKWMFEKRGCAIVSLKEQSEDWQNKEKLELAVIEAGAEDIHWHNDFLNIHTKPEELEKIREAMEKTGIKTESASLDWVAKETLELSDKDRKACQYLFETLDENEAVQEIYSNLKPES